jgi:hypothetical protein
LDRFVQTAKKRGFNFVVAGRTSASSVEPAKNSARH